MTMDGGYFKGSGVIDLGYLEKLLKVARAADVLQLKLGDIEFTLQPTPPKLDVAEMEPEDLGLPADPGAPDLEPTSPYTPPGTPVKRKRGRPPKPKLTPDGERVVDASNLLNPENPVDFSSDFPAAPEVPGWPQP
jgi:hypothetical protein